LKNKYSGETGPNSRLVTENTAFNTHALITAN